MGTKKLAFMCICSIILTGNLYAYCCQCFESSSGSSDSSYTSHLQSDINSKIKPEIENTKKNLNKLHGSYIEIEKKTKKILNANFYAFHLKQSKNKLLFTKYKKLSSTWDLQNLKVKAIQNRLDMKMALLNQAINETSESLTDLNE